MARISDKYTVILGHVVELFFNSTFSFGKRVNRIKSRHTVPCCDLATNPNLSISGTSESNLERTGTSSNLREPRDPPLKRRIPRSGFEGSGRIGSGRAERASERASDDIAAA